MKPLKFKNIGIIARHRGVQWQDSLLVLIQCLKKLEVNLFIEAETAHHGNIVDYPVLNREDLIEPLDLLIVIGGDGSLLQAAHIIMSSSSKKRVPLLGINRGRLGFLTDILPKDIEKKIPDILAGNFYEESRFLLQAEIHRNSKIMVKENALNEVVLLPGHIAHMIEFEIHINHHFVSRQRADGLIIATPTGSTAYALSGGGPIIHPALDAIVLVPMFPHTLSSRPLVVSKESTICIRLPTTNDSHPGFSCDGFPRQNLDQNDILIIRPKEQRLSIIHPQDYEYFQTLRTKLNWEYHLTYSAS